jgi:hypothetical protein
MSSVPEALSQFEIARRGHNGEPRIGHCYPEVSYEEHETFVAAFSSFHYPMMGVAPERCAGPRSHVFIPHQPVDLETPPRESEQPGASPATGIVTPEALIRPESVVDYTALVEDLRRQDKGIPAKLVEFMADKTSASCEDVGREVHDDENARDQTVRMNARRTNDELAKLGSRVSFRVTTGWVFKDVSPE